MYGKKPIKARWEVALARDPSSTQPAKQKMTTTKPAPITIALAQLAVSKAAVDDNLQMHLTCIERAAALGANVVAFPELSLTGYELALLSQLAMPRDDATFAVLTAAAVANNTVVIAGCPLHNPNGKPHIAAVICFFPTLINMIRGLDSAGINEHELFRMLSASRWEVFWRLRLPRSMPLLFSSLRISSATAVIGAIVGEWIGSDKGLGALIIQATFNYQSDRLYAAIVLSSLLAIGIFAMVVTAERLVVREP